MNIRVYLNQLNKKESHNMNKDTYNKIYRSLNSIEDIAHISNYFNIHKGIIYSIFSQKIVYKVKSNYTQLKKSGSTLLKQWNNGKTIVEIANEKNIPPTLIVSIILKELNIPKKMVFNCPQKIYNKRLQKEILDAWKLDHFFSPLAHEIQSKRGKLGEEIIDLWLQNIKIDYLSEQQLRIQNLSKTPDFLFNDPLIINGQKIYWIESKSMFGSEYEHKYYTKKQFTFYEQMGGSGLIVYWYGYVDTISNQKNMIADYTFFSQYKKKITDLMNLGVPQ